MARLKVIVPLALTSFILSVFIAGAYSTYPAEGRIAIVNKRQKVLTVVNLKDHSRQVFDVGYLPHETVVAQGRVFVSNYGNEISGTKYRSGTYRSALRSGMFGTRIPPV